MSNKRLKLAHLETLSASRMTTHLAGLLEALPLLLLLLLPNAAQFTYGAAVGSSPAEDSTTLAAPTITPPSTPSPPNPPPPQPLVEPPPTPAGRKTEVIIIDVTKNTSSVVSITIEGEVVPPANLTEAELRRRKAAAKFRCLVQEKANIFMIVHLNRNWRQKLGFIQQLLGYTYRQDSTNLAIVFFNAFTNILATFGSNPLSSETELLLALAQVQKSMENDESAAVTEHWSQFQLDDALKACHRYAKLFLRQFSLDARPSVLVSYFDDSAVITDATLTEVEKVLQSYRTSSPFCASVSILQWPTSLPMPPQWARVAELLSSSPSYQVSGSTEESLLGAVADLAGSVCNSTQVKP